MQVRPQELTTHLTQQLAPVYLVGGDETLIVDECCTAIRLAAQTAGYADREVYTVDRSFDWGALRQSSKSLSLFSEKRMFELRIPTAKPGDSGRKFLQEYLQEPADDILLLIITGKLDKQVKNTKWVKQLDKVGIMTVAYPVTRRELPDWIGARLKSRDLTAEPGVVALLAYHFEGNLLALAQEVDKLALLFGQQHLIANDIEHHLSDNARFSVFALVDACIEGDAAAVMRILGCLRADGTDPVLIIWALARESRTMASVVKQLQSGDNEAHVFQNHQIWPSRRPLVKKALRRTSARHWLLMLRRAARADRILKGRMAGDVWQELQCLGLAMSGSRSLVCQCG